MPRHASSNRSSPSRWQRLFDEHLPGYDPSATAAPGDVFDARAADFAVAFFHECLVFIEGEKAGHPFVLEPWQQAIVGCLFGWQRADGTRRYREAMIYVPRKNGKTPLCAGLVLLCMFTDHEPGAQIYSAAAEREQAALVFRHANGMLAREPEMASRAKVYRTFKSIELPAENTIYKALSADADTKHGLGAHVLIIDELHAHRSRELVDVLMTSTAARRQPLVVHITTADYDRESICNEKYQYACSVRDGVIQDRAFLPVIYEAPVDADWTASTTWAAANPNLGVSVSADYLARECKRAQEQASYENTFKRLHLNMRTQQDVRWLRLEAWDACCPTDDPLGWRARMMAELQARRCYGAFDLSSTRDITALLLWFPDDDGPIMLPWFFVPADNVKARSERDKVPYDVWVRQGLITATEGNVVDYEAVRQKLIEVRDRYEIVDVAADPWNATHLITELQGDGFSVVMFRQGFASMSAPSKEFEKLVAAGKLQHGMNPVLRWMASHVAIEQDAAGNIKPSKKKSTERIDGIVTGVMALGRAMVTPDSTSVYETTDRQDGLLVIG